jgi:hypothetical protein
MSPQERRMQSNDWTARRILRELCDPDRRLEILSCFWSDADDMSRRVAVAQLARSLRFREGTLRKLPVEKKAQLLASRIGSAEYEEFFEAALLSFHLVRRKELMAAFLDAWGIPHQDGAIEQDAYKPPTQEEVEQALSTLGERFERDDMILYLATAGLVMGDAGSDWRGATWPVVSAVTGSADAS